MSSRPVKATRMRPCLKIQKNNNVANTDLSCCSYLLKMMNGIVQGIPRSVSVSIGSPCVTSRICSLLWWLVLSVGQDLGPRKQPSRHTCEDLNFCQPVVSMRRMISVRSSLVGRPRGKVGGTIP